ncbi:response regulator [Caldimonas brevitalea]|uniref:Sensor histidine kinase n=1 Tax=Caldimonas brevitalea TaxID=413882 RepID=A0A0G3BV45_9BURK|nr:response regulator [Caldimonas brevitalea]AKJ31893.1 sensor histidine kinase [Caldimonas brevitalea]
MEFSELFAQSAREVLPLARAKGLVSYFDYLGPYIDMPLGDTGTHAAAHRIMLGMTDCMDAGFVMFCAEVETPVTGVSSVVVHAAGTGTAAAAGAIEDVRQRLQLRTDAALNGQTGATSGVCPATGGRVEFIDAGSEGLVISLKTSFRAVELRGAEPLPYAEGVAAWLVSPVLGSLDSVGRRLRRLGWHVRSFRSLAEVSTQLLLPEREPGAATPMLLVAAEFSQSDLAEMEHIAATIPSLWTVLAVLAGSPTLLARGATAVDIRVLPLSPRELEQFTAHIDRRTSTSVSRETAPSPLYAPDAGFVLVVDDSPVNQLVARAQLELLGYEVAVVADGSAALAFCHQHPPDMVLMDVDMPVMGGLEATGRLRAQQQVGALPPFPIVAATADDNPLRRHACSDAGMDGYLAKPVDLLALADEVHRVLPTRPLAHG